MINFLLAKKVSFPEKELIASSLLSTSNILIIDDDQEICSFLQKAFRKIGCAEVSAALSGAELAASILRLKPDLVLLDLRIGQDDYAGLKLAKKIKELADLPVIFITGHAEDEVLSQVRESEPYGFLKKPIDLLDLKFTAEIALYRHLQDSLREREIQLRTTETRIEQILNSLIDYRYTVLLKDGEAVRTIHYPGCEVVTGYSPQEWESDPELWIKVIPEDQRDAVRDFADSVLLPPAVKSIEHSFHHKSGRVIWVKSTIILNYDSAGQIVSYDGVLTDITERKNAELALLSYQENLEKLVYARTIELRLAHEQKMRELEQAKLVQKVLLPGQEDMVNSDIYFHYRFLPSEELSGDYISITPMREKKACGVFLGDVSGHGVPAGLLTFFIKGSIDRICQQNGTSPGSFLEALNRSILRLFKENNSSYFVAALYGIFYKKDGLNYFNFANAGQPPPLIFHKEKNEFEYINKPGKWLGVVEQVSYSVLNVPLRRGDRVFLYTDGLVESISPENEMLDTDGLLKIFYSLLDQELSLQNTIDSALELVNTFRGSHSAADDIILFGAEIK